MVHFRPALTVGTCQQKVKCQNIINSQFLFRLLLPNTWSAIYGFRFFLEYWSAAFFRHSKKELRSTFKTSYCNKDNCMITSMEHAGTYESAGRCSSLLAMIYRRTSWICCCIRPEVFPCASSSATHLGRSIRTEYVNCRGNKQLQGPRRSNWTKRTFRGLLPSQ
jgi:hypothetical protein